MMDWVGVSEKDPYEIIVVCFVFNSNFIIG
jgi:hypothetical protein